MYSVIKFNSRTTWDRDPSGWGAANYVAGPPTGILQTEDFDQAQRAGMTWARDNGLLTTTHTYSWVEGTPAGQSWVLRSQNDWTDVQIIRTEGTES